MKVNSIMCIVYSCICVNAVVFGVNTQIAEGPVTYVSWSFVFKIVE